MAAKSRAVSILSRASTSAEQWFRRVPGKKSLEESAHKPAQRLLKLMHAEQEQPEPGRQSPGIQFVVQEQSIE